MKEIIKKLNDLDNIAKHNTIIDSKEYHLFYYKELIDVISLFKIIDNLKSLDNNSIIERLDVISYNDVIYRLTSGEALIYRNASDYGFVKVSSIPKRTITESSIDPVNLFGSKEGLIEDILSNYALIQKRIHSSNLKYLEVKVGSISQTSVRISYIEGLIDNDIVFDLYNKIKQLNLKSIRTVSDIANIINRNSLLPNVQLTSSTEVITNSLINGRIVILIDGFPVSLVCPVGLMEFTNLPDEASGPTYYLVYTRIMTYVLLFISIFAVGLYICIINYHSQVLSMQIISEIITSLKGSTLPLIIEIFFIIFIFEFLRIASSKTPASYVQNLVITVGGLLIGQNAVNSGFVSPFNLVLIALSYLSSYGITNNKHLIISFNYLRIIIILFSFFFGILGYMISSILIINYLVKKSSYNIEYFDILSLKNILSSFSSKLKQANLATKAPYDKN